MTPSQFPHAHAECMAIEAAKDECIAELEARLARVMADRDSWRRMAESALDRSLRLERLERDR